MAPKIPLEGVRVLELTTAWAGPFTGRILGDLGAEVIKIESRRRMDVRGPAKPPPGTGSYPDKDPGTEPWNRAARFHERNRSKLSVSLELNDARARDAFLRLAKVSDVVLENFSPRVLPQLGLAYDDLIKVQPAMVMVSLSGFGQSGPERDNVAYGPTVEQVSGLASILGYADGVPTSSGLFLPDVLGGTLASGLVMSALRRRAVTGEGTYIDLAEIEVVRWMMGHTVLAAQAGRDSATARLGNRHAEFVPHGVFPCDGEDRWVAVVVRTDAEWAALATAIGQPDLASTYPTRDARAAAVDILEGAITAWTRTRTQDDVVAQLRQAGVPVSVVASIDQVFSNEQLRARETFSMHPVPGSRSREVSGSLWQIDGFRPGLRTPAPGLGEHNEYVLGELAGLSAAEIDDLRAAGVVGNLPAELDPA